MKNNVEEEMKKQKLFSKNPVIINFFIVLALILIFYIIIIRQHGIIYQMNDDIALRAISSGKYTGKPTFYMIFSGFPYSTLLVLLYKITNKIDWYGLILILLMMFYLCYTIYSIIRTKKDTFKKVIDTTLILSVVAILFNRFFIELTFTSVSAFIVTCCLILYLLPDAKLKNIIMTIGIVLSLGIRLKSCLMILVFFVPALFYKNYGNKEGLKKDFILGIKIGIILLICIIIDKSFYTDANWKEYLAYNNLRSLYYDYYYKTIENLPIETSTEIFHNAGFDDKEMELLRSYGGIVFYDDIPSKMEALIEQCKSHNLKLNSDLKVTLRHTFGTIQVPCYVVTLVLIAYLIISSSDKKGKILTVLPFIILQLIILIYLIRGGRILDRVMVPLYTCYVVTNMYIILQEEKSRKVVDKFFDCDKVVITILVMLIFILSMGIDIDNTNLVLANKGNMMLQYFEEHPKNFYIYDNNYLAKFEFFNKYSTPNYINMSGWTAYAPIHEEAIKNQGANSLKELLFKDNVYMVLNSTDVEKYQDLDLNTKIEEVDSIEEFHIYKFTK